MGIHLPYEKLTPYILEEQCSEISLQFSSPLCRDAQKKLVNLMLKQKSSWQMNFLLVLENAHPHTHTCAGLMEEKKHTLPQSLDITCLTIWLHWWCICIFFSALPCILLLPGRFIEPGNLGCVSWSTLSPNKISWLRLTLSL